MSVAAHERDWKHSLILSNQISSVAKQLSKMNSIKVNSQSFGQLGYPKFDNPRHTLNRIDKHELMRRFLFLERQFYWLGVLALKCNVLKYVLNITYLAVKSTDKFIDTVCSISQGIQKSIHQKFYSSAAQSSTQFQHGKHRECLVA